MRDILYTIAYDPANQLVLAVNAVKGEKYRCPECKGEMIPRRSVEQKRGAKRPHYAHKVLSPNCKPESVLHFGFKRLLSERIQGNLDRREPLPVRWKCSTCEKEHKGNILKKATQVNEEFSLGSCRPDIALIGEGNVAVWALEVVVTHAPEEHVVDYYRKHRIALARFDLRSDTDLEKATAQVLEPDHVDQCVNPRCSKCGRFQRNVVLWIIEAGCWKCGCVMPLAIVDGGESRGGSFAGPEHFTDQELTIARAKGCLIRNNYSRTQRRSYPANTCKECGAFAGEYHLFDQYIVPADRGELKSEKLDVGYYCEHCDTEAMRNGELNYFDDEDEEEPGFMDEMDSTRKQKPRFAAIPESEKVKEGFCIRCRVPIVRNSYKPLCASCFPHEATRERLRLPIPKEHSYCLRCGEAHETTRWKPFCLPCFYIAGSQRRTPIVFVD